MSTDADRQLDRLAADYWQATLRRKPIVATFYGDERYNDRLPDVGPRGRANEERELRDFLARLDALQGTPFKAERAITADMLRLALTAGLETLRLRIDEMDIDQMDGPQVWLPELLNWHPTDTGEHVQQLIARFRAFETFMNDYLDNLRDGIREGRTAPEIAVERVLAQVDALLSTPPESSPLAAAAVNQPLDLGDQWRGVVGDVVYPAYARFQTFLAEYLQRHARRDPGVWAVTDGAEIYAFMASQHTTTTLSPDELHQFGRDDLARIHEEMRAIVRARGGGDTTIRDFTASLISDPKNLPSDREELLEIAQALLARSQAALPRAFGRVPHAAIEVRPVEPFRERDAPAGFYFQPSADGTRPAIFYMNTFEPQSRPKHTLPALAFHEGVPGHHLQIALAQEATDLPEFRRLSAGWLANAFVEGWALYTERLADELGLYDDDLARYGMLGYQAWRACRLIVDTGLHHLRWTRQQAIDFFLDNVGLSERETLNEVDRYIAWPGQALAYKVGQREIESIRRSEEIRLGAAFDLRAFHDAVLAHAGIPLSTLRKLFTST
ncbi:MAG: DUF885 domain-containing protein [Chloroflexota bacterium]